MNVTKDVIADLFPLYVAQECSADTRVLVDAYLRSHPAEAAEFARAAGADALLGAPVEGGAQELGLLRAARQRQRTRSLLMGFAIFCTLAPLSFFIDGKRHWMLLTDAPLTAAAHLIGAVALWIAYAAHCRRYADR